MTVEVKITPGKTVSRTEMLLRIVYGIAFYFLLIIFGLAAGVIVFINIFSCLILAKRVAPEYTAKFLEWITHIYAYFYLITDERPPWTPK